MLKTRYASEKVPSTFVVAKSPIVRPISSPPGFSRSLATIACDMSIPWTGTPRWARGSATRPVPIPSSRARPSPASSARKSTTGSSTSGSNMSADDSSYRAATGSSKYPSSRTAGTYMSGVRRRTCLEWATPGYATSLSTSSSRPSCLFHHSLSRRCKCALGLRDVRGELVLLRAELLLELGQSLLARLELVEPDLDVRLVASLAALELLLAVVDLPDALAEVRLRLPEALLALVDPLAGRVRKV